MFIDIDYSKRKQDVKLHLARPNKRVIDVIDEKFATKITIKLGDINQLTFSIPYLVEDESGNMVLNNHVNTIKEKMLVRVTLGAYQEWYIVDSIEEDADTSDTFNVTAFSLGYELKTKRISGYTEDSIKATDLLTNLLQNTIWKIGTVDAMFDAMYRSFDSGDDSNVLDCITNAGETYGALIVWDTKSRTVSFKDATKNGQWRGMTVDYGKFLNTIKRTRTTDEMVTRMYVYGAVDSTTNIALSIQGVNPTGQPYIENFGYFMYPFQRDASKNILQHSDFMSDELCQALLDHDDTVNTNTSAIQNLQNEIATDQTTLTSQQTQLTDYQGQMKTLNDQLDIAKSSNDQTTIDSVNSQITTLQGQIDQQNSDISATQQDITNKQSQLTDLQNQCSMQQTFTQSLLDELNLYVIESVWRDDRYIDENDLWTDAQTKFNEIRQPKVVIDVEIDNLLNVIEEQYYWDKIVLGDLIKVKYPQMGIEYMAKMIQFDYDFDNENISITVANTTDLLSDTEKLIQLLYSNSSATTAVENNKYKWNKVDYVQNQVNNLLSSQWDATKNEIIAGVHNTITIGGRGIIIKNPDTPDDVVIMQAGVIALSQDGGTTWKTAVKPDGIVAEQLIGQIITGSTLLITNQSGTFTLDNNGAVFDVDSFVVQSGGAGTNLATQWQNSSDWVNSFVDDNTITPYEKDGIQTEWNKISNEYNTMSSTIDAYYGSSKTTIQFVIDFNNAYNDLYNYLFVTNQSDGTPIMGNTTVASIVDSTTYKSKFTTYYNSRNTVNNQLSTKAMDTATTAQSNVDAVKNDIVYKTELHSSNGTQFKNGDITTILTVVVYKGKDDITSTLSASSFLWKKINKDGTDDTTWNNAHVGVGNTIQVTKDDVNQSATFWCDIDIT